MSGAERFLARVVGALNGAAVPYMLAGSFASSHHGVPRATQDIDIVVDPTFDSLDRFLAAMKGDDVYFDTDVAREEFKRRSQFNIIDGSTAWKVDVIFRKARPFSKEEMSRRVPAKVLGIEVFVATVEDTVLAKLEWAKMGGSERQLDDVRAILRTKGAALDGEYIERWLDELAIRELWTRVCTT
ncbi:MAG: nucleotidyltransferase family protein [Myxococcota bacterium]|nr:nucleotidyltransferase family protein [Myxococcota bacterium]